MTFETTWNRLYTIVLYDLLILLKQYAVVESHGTSYLFLGSIRLEKEGSPDYPLCFIEVDFDTARNDSVRLSIPRDLVMLNTPAVNSFDFKNVLTIPRASSFSGGMAHLRRMDSFLTGEYSLTPQTITTSDTIFVPAPREGLPYLKYRFGLRVIKSEDKRILDYSELMTRIEKGQGGAIIDFVEDYIKEKVVVTHDEITTSFRERYPKNTARYFYSDNPLPLNPSQKKILTALDNRKNRVIVVDGPPGTGKSHTIGAITYWANQNKKSIIITSHKKEALDVVERMLTDKFTALHPHGKPSVIRITKANDLNTINTIDNSLSLPVIDGAAKRADDFNRNAIERDQTKVRESLEQIIDAAIGAAKQLPRTSHNLLRYLLLEEELALDSVEISGTVSEEMVDNLRRVEEFATSASLPEFDDLSLDTVTALYQRRHDIPRILDACNALTRYTHDLRAIADFQEAVKLVGMSYRDLYQALDRVRGPLEDLQPRTIDALLAVRGLYGPLLRRVGIDFSRIATIGKLATLTRDEQKLVEFVRLHAELSHNDSFLPEIHAKLNELNGYNQRLTEYANDLRLKGFQNHPADMARIRRQIANGQRLTSEQATLLCATYSCIIAEPEAIFKYFPMDEGLIDILIFDEASQVSIAHSLSLILRAKQVLVFGDRYQYGAVSVVNVSRKYGGEYFRRIVNDYVREYNGNLTEEQQAWLVEEETREISDDDLSIHEPIRDSHLAAHKEWLKAFSIRMSTLDFCQEIRNYNSSLDEHFRSFPEIIAYSNEFFYRQAQIPLIINRLRTKPIDEVLCFIKVETQGNSGKNVNLDELEAIRFDLERRIAAGYKGTIGVITSFREQRTRAEQYFREKLPSFHRLKEESKLAVWFVGDVQGEERDLVYYSFVQDKKLDNADLRSIYPTPGGTADSINSLKMQRLNVGFSRAKDTMLCSQHGTGQVHRFPAGRSNHKKVTGGDVNGNHT